MLYNLAIWKLEWAEFYRSKMRFHETMFWILIIQIENSEFWKTQLSLPSRIPTSSRKHNPNNWVQWSNYPLGPIIRSSGPIIWWGYHGSATLTRKYPQIIVFRETNWLENGRLKTKLSIFRCHKERSTSKMIWQ